MTRPTDKVPPTPERLSKGDILALEGDRGGLELRSLQFPLDFYFRRGHISGPQYRAGKQLYALWFNSTERSRYVQWRYTREPTGTQDPDFHCAMRTAYFAARRSIRGVEEQRVAFSVCCMGDKAGKRGGMLRLRAALDDLASHFREERKKQLRDGPRSDTFSEN
jgi:hypothetical protein